LERSENFTRRVGESTVETSAFFLGRVLDLTGSLRERFQDIEIMDLGGSRATTLILDRSNVAHLAGSNGDAFGANTLLVKGDAADLVNFADNGWVKGGSVIDPYGNSGTFETWTNHAVTVLVEDDVKDPKSMATALRHLPQQQLPSQVVVPGLLDGQLNVERLVNKWLARGRRPQLTVARRRARH